MLSAMRTQVRHSGCPVPCDFPFSISQLHPNLRIILAFVTSRIVEFFLQVWSYLSIWGPPKLPPSPSKNRKTNQPLTTWDGPDMHWPTECAGFGFWRYCFGACGSNVLKKYETIMDIYHHFRCVVRRGWISLHWSTVPGIITFLVTPTAIVSR